LAESQAVTVTTVGRASSEPQADQRQSIRQSVYEQMCCQASMNTTFGSQPTTRPSRVTYTS
jgi:hypothetical protein